MYAVVHGTLVNQSEIFLYFIIDVHTHAFTSPPMAGLKYTQKRFIEMNLDLQMTVVLRILIKFKQRQ